jgi:predicted secreted protein
MAYVRGNKIRFYSGGVQLSLELEVTISATMETIPTTDKDSASWTSIVDGDKSWTVSGSANLDWTATENISQTFTDFTAGEAVLIDVGSATNAKFYSGSGYITSWNLEAPVSGLATFSFEVQGTGALTEGTTT